MKFFSILLVFTMFFAQNGFAVNKTWNGGSGSWSVAASWSPVGVPNNSDFVTINSGTVSISNMTNAECAGMGNFGTVHIAGGTSSSGILEILGDGIHEGTFILDGPNTLLLFSGGINEMNGATLTGTGTVQHWGGATTVFNAGTTVAATLKLDHLFGTITDNIGITWASAKLFAGTLNGTGSPTISGNTEFTNTGTYTLDGTGTLTTIGPVAFNASWLTIKTKTFRINGGMTLNAGDLIIDNGGVFDIPAGAVFQVPYSSTDIVSNVGGGTVNLAGTLQKSNSSGVFIVGPTIAFNNTGTVNLTAGTMRLQKGADHTGTWLLDGATTVLELAGNGSHSFTSATLTGTGTVLVYNQTNVTTFNAGTSLAPTLKLQVQFGATARMNTNLVWAAITMSGGKMDTGLPNILTTVSGPLLWNSGEIHALDNTCTLTVNGLTTLNGGSAQRLNYSTINPNGGMTWNSGNIQLDNGAVWNIPTGLLVSTSTPGHINTATPGSGGSFNLSGTFQKTGGAAMNLGTGTTFQNSGTVKILGGPFNISGNFVNNPSGTIAGNAPGNWVFFGGSSFTNSGKISPGASIGTLHVSRSGLPIGLHIKVLDIEIAAGSPVQKDLLNITGNLEILAAATLNVSETQCLDDGTYTIITYTGTRTGTFSTLNLPAGYTVAYDDAGKKVNLVYDDPNPAITFCPADLEVCEGAPVNIDPATATDNCSGVMVSNDAPPTFTVGTTIVTHTATDSKSQTATCEQTVTVVSGVPGDNDCDGFSPVTGDCNDSDDTVFPGAPELCDMLDNDCDGIWNEGLLLNTTKIVGTITNSTCINGTDGAINVTTTLGTAPYTWQWFGPNGFSATTEDVSGLVPGNYWVVVDDAAANRCPKAKKFIVKGAAATMSPAAACGTVKGKLLLTTLKLTGQTITYLWSTGATTNSITAVAGTYSVTLTLKTTAVPPVILCTYVMNGTIEAAPAITIPSVTVSGTGPNGTALVNTAGGTAPITFKGKRTSAPILTLAAQSTPTFSPLQSGIYRFEVVDNKGCKASKTNVVVPSALPPGEMEERGDFDLEETPQFSVFPNPVENQCFVQRDLSSFEKLTNLNVQVFDAAGRFVLEKPWDAEAETLELDFGPETPLGVFVIKILAEDGSLATVLRVVKM